MLHKILSLLSHRHTEHGCSTRVSSDLEIIKYKTSMLWKTHQIIKVVFLNYNKYHFTNKHFECVKAHSVMKIGIAD